MNDNKKSVFIKLIILLAGGIGLNVLGAWLMRRFDLPLYMDSIGTMLAAALGGFLPGIITGYLSNLVNGINDPDKIYFAFTSVLIALCAGYFEEKGWFRNIWKSLLSVLIFTVAGGGVGFVIAWLLFGSATSESLTSPLARYFVESGVMNAFWAQMSNDLILDVADKGIAVAVVIIVLRLIPPEIHDKLKVRGWMQKPLTREERKAVESDVSRTISMKSKIVFYITLAAFIIAAATAGISFLLYNRATIESHKGTAQGVSSLVAGIIPGDRVDEFIEKGEDAPGYEDIERALYNIRGSSPEIEYVYVYKIMPDGCHVVFDLDTDDVSGGEPGDVIPFDSSFESMRPDLLAGNEIEPIITDDTFGWLMTSYTPVHDSAGNTVCYAAADVSMHKVRRDELSFITRVVTLFFGFFIIILAVGVWVAEYTLIYPINTMAMVAGEFACNTEEARDDGVEKFNELAIETGDEIEHLYNSFATTMASTVAYLEESRTQSDALSKMQNGLILVLADLVESRDKCTGDHVRKTAAYVRIILEQLDRDGVFPDIITEEYIDDVANSAPLHDVGKISVPDSILNKQGKLTDEEFAQMKKHTTAGKEIISKAIALVSDSGYLMEAKNLATSHHEKWNGTGYPYGLKGDEIPLSARVMAVADVFDALVSKRSYKEPFSYDKAVSIIEEGSGSHFDARVVAAFMKAMPEIKRIYQINMNETSTTKGDQS